MLKKLVLGAVVAASCLVGTAANATPYYGKCTGTVDTNCSYCSYDGGPVQNPWYCDNVGGHWRWEFCQVWVAGGCRL